MPKKKSKRRQQRDAQQAASQQAALDSASDDSSAPPSKRSKPLPADPIPPPPPSVLEYLSLLSSSSSSSSSSPPPILSPPFKPLRTILHPLIASLLTRYSLPDYPSLLTSSLSSKNWAQARLHLEALLLYLPLGCDGGRGIRQGTFQRWVRALDFCGAAGLRMELLGMVLKVQNMAGVGEGGGNAHDVKAAAEEAARALLEGEEGTSAGGVPVDAEEGGGEFQVVSPTASELALSLSNETIYVERPEGPLAPAADALTVVYSEAAAERRPPNHHPLVTWKAPPAVEPLFLAGSTAVTKHLIPSVPGAFLLLNVLSPAECDYIVATCERMGYKPDHPVHQDEPTGIDATEWLVTPDRKEGEDSVAALEREGEGCMLGVLQARVLGHMPEIGGGGAAGINPRWRAFRYGEGGIYRPHIDGSWTCAGEGSDGVYNNDVRGDRRSKLTFLMYLNDGFQGGGTTFYLPDLESEGGGVVRRAVQPVRGGCLVFPQGNVASLVHEGAEVVGGGPKYVVRTDVIYKDKSAAS
ncbi:hypothetical protein TeGR_g2010 [Tetraparma gracilis]|uniref:Fe2OG dioxygenase domain-containing protein n=1 Tax=Tetraparma gracilis TaxID=2962635 RepID=A0ABQ6N2T7_9STRA|nr:hypothetical protein TeGR_g2010 [Tetraparma gracilis]